MADESDNFVEEHRHFVNKLVRRVVTQFHLEREREDITAAAYAGLVEARQRFDPDRGVKFTSFAYYRVRGAMIDTVRRSHLPRRLYEALAAEEASDRVTEELGQARVANRDKEDATTRVHMAMRAVDRLATARAVTTTAAEDTYAGADFNPEANLLRKEAIARVRTVIDGLPERERQVIQGIYFEGRKRRLVAEELGLSPSWLSRFHAKILDTISRELRATAGPNSEED